MPTGNMLWFTGSSTEGLPFIHDSFRANLKAVHHKPRLSRRALSERGAATRNATVTTPGTARDLSKAVLDSESFRLPNVETVPICNGQVTARSTGRGDGSKEPASFTSYMHRYKACARLKGISPSRAYCATRTRTSSSDHNQIDSGVAVAPPPSHCKDSFNASTTSTPFRLDSKTDHSKAAVTDAVKSEGSPVAESGPVPGGTEEALERQIEEKLKRGSSQDDGMAGSGLQHSGRQLRKKGRKGGATSEETGRTAGHHAAAGGGRPLGDIVSPQRLQELLNNQDDRTLPYTYYRTSVAIDDPQLENVDIESAE